jgi:hypothetical protein
VHAAPADFAFGDDVLAVLLGDLPGFAEGVGDFRRVANRIGIPGFDAGGAVDADAAEAAAAALAADFTPMSDLRASAGYRLQVAGNLIRRAAREAGGATAVSVWDRSLSATEAS